MNLLNLFSVIHWIPVVLLTLFSFFLGAAWHSSFLFGMVWKRENKYDPVPKKISYPLIFGGTAVFHFLAIAALSAAVSGMGLLTGFINGILIAVIWIVPAMGGTYLFANRSIKLLAIDAGMYVLLYTVSGGILGIW